MVKSSEKVERFADADVLAHALAVDIAVRLAHAIASRSRASLLVSGVGANVAWNGLAEVSRPFDATVLGIGGDGHTASLFPGSPGLHAALDPAAPAACVATRSPTVPHERLSLNLSALLDSRHVSLLILGDEKLRTYRMARSRGSIEEMPIRGIINQQRVPVEVLWAPTMDANKMSAESAR